MSPSGFDPRLVLVTNNSVYGRLLSPVLRPNTVDYQLLIREGNPDLLIASVPYLHVPQLRIHGLIEMQLRLYQLAWSPEGLGSMILGLPPHRIIRVRL